MRVFPKYIFSYIGPQSLSACLDSMGHFDGGMGSPEYIGQDNVDNYNVISLDQRGLGYVCGNNYFSICSIVFGTPIFSLDIHPYFPLFFI